jgi:hypothetical protein
MKATLVLDEKTEEQKHYSITKKICLCEFALVQMEQDLASLNSIASELGIALLCLSRWMNHLPQYHFIAKQDLVRYSLHSGKENQLDCIGAEL